MNSDLHFVVIPQNEGLRLDQAIASQLDSVSRTKARSVIATGGVFVDGKRTKVAGRRVRGGQRVQVFLGQEKSALRKEPIEAIEIPVVWQSETVVVVDKPSGVFSAPTPQTDRHDLVAYLSAQLKVPAASPLHLVHRLDRPTSGLMVLAKTPSAAAELSRQIAAHEMKRSYYAVLAGPLEAARTVDEPLSGKSAVSFFRPLRSCRDATWVEVELETGRTHQIRRHAEFVGAPVFGDSKYGRRLLHSARLRAPRLALHAHTLRFCEPGSGAPLQFQSPMPHDLAAFWDSLAGLEDIP